MKKLTGVMYYYPFEVEGVPCYPLETLLKDVETASPITIPNFEDHERMLVVGKHITEPYYVGFLFTTLDKTPLFARNKTTNKAERRDIEDDLITTNMFLINPLKQFGIYTYYHKSMSQKSFINCLNTIFRKKVDEEVDQLKGHKDETKELKNVLGNYGRKNLRFASLSIPKKFEEILKDADRILDFQVEIEPKVLVPELNDINAFTGEFVTQRLFTEFHGGLEKQTIIDAILSSLTVTKRKRLKAHIIESGIKRGIKDINNREYIKTEPLDSAVEKLLVGPDDYQDSEIITTMIALLKEKDNLRAYR